MGHRVFVLIALTLSIFVSAWSVFAAETSNNVLSLKPEIQRGNLQDPKGFWPFIGVGLGVMDHNDRIRTGGIPSHVKIIGSYNFEKVPWIADGGIGLHNEFLTQDGGDDDTIQSLYTELAARYKLNNKWQLGAIWNTLVDNPDRYKSNTENLASFVGLQVMKEFTWDNEYLIRGGARAMTDVGISGETIDTVMAELQVSFGPSAKSEVIRVEQTPRPVAPHLASRAIQTFEIDPGPVNFESDSTKLVGHSNHYLRRLARALASNRHLFERVEVVGHADQRGPDSYNDRLSQRRARAISDALVAAGISSGQIRSVGRGEHDLVSSANTPAALQRNRRVELEFHGVRSQEALKNIIDSVQR